jgi:hypothetical protein
VLRGTRASERSEHVSRSGKLFGSFLPCKARRTAAMQPPVATTIAHRRKFTGPEIFILPLTQLC